MWIMANTLPFSCLMVCSLHTLGKMCWYFVVWKSKHIVSFCYPPSVYIPWSH
jgi:hypothetical protein